jgi:hypothetical protein
MWCHQRLSEPHVMSPAASEPHVMSPAAFSVISMRFHRNSLNTKFRTLESMKWKFSNHKRFYRKCWLNFRDPKMRSNISWACPLN